MCVCVCVCVQSFENIDFSVTVLLLLPSHLAWRKERELQPLTQAGLTVCVFTLLTGRDLCNEYMYSYLIS